MLRILLIDLKRLFSNKLSLALIVIAPVITLLLLASLIAPLFFSNRRLSDITVAIFQEDFSEDVQFLMDDITSDHQIASIVTFDFVDSLDVGQTMLANGDAAIFLYIPAGLMEDLYQREPTRVEAWVSDEYAFEASVITPILDSFAEGFNQLQLTMDYFYFQARSGLPQDLVWEHYYDVSVYLGLRVLNRTSLFEMEGVSPLGRLLPIEYYTSAIFAFFIALGLIPLSGYNAKDLSSGAIGRGLAVTRWRYQYFLVRMISGAIYIMLVTVPMLGVGIIILGQDIFYSGNLLALFGVAAVSALSFSCLSILVGLIFPKNDNAVWVAFYFVITMALMGGVIFPDDAIPTLITSIGQLSPLRASMSSFAIALFDYQFSKIGPALGLLVAWLVVSLTLSLSFFNKRVQQ